MTYLFRNRKARKTLPAVLVLATLALVAACGGTSTGGNHNASDGRNTSSSAAHNSADVAFATDMIPHHAQAVEMADMALKAAVDPEVKALAQAIKGAQDPEIKTMSGWLTSWKAPVPPTGMSMTGGNSMGMMSGADMAALGKATGAAFDKMWVAMMTRHHTGAIAMATTELGSGQFPDAKTLAQRIVTSQTAEVAKMKAIAQRLG
jgi:uncharacterized protein (DUF305 family)